MRGNEAVDETTIIAAAALAVVAPLRSPSRCPAQDAQDAIAKPPNGTCPFGWTLSGSYCLKSGTH